VEFRRFIAWYPEFFVDIFKVEAPRDCVIDYTLHARGERLKQAGVNTVPVSWDAEGPSQFFHSAVKAEPGNGTLRTAWRLNGGHCLEALSLLQDGGKCYYLLGPDNPSVSDLSYMIQRKTGKSALFLNVVSVSRESAAQIQGVDVEFRDGHRHISVRLADERAEDLICPF
jgi:hypothetical protein